jgi:hypothetical protein
LKKSVYIFAFLLLSLSGHGCQIARFSTSLKHHVSFNDAEKALTKVVVARTFKVDFFTLKNYSPELKKDSGGGNDINFFVVSNPFYTCCSESGLPKKDFLFDPFYNSCYGKRGPPAFY